MGSITQVEEEDPVLWFMVVVIGVGGIGYVTHRGYLALRMG